MKICVTSTGKDKDSLMDQRFGRCQYFMIYDTKTEKYSFIENKGVISSQGAGIASGQQILDENVDVVITGSMGPNALKVLQAGNVSVYKGQGGKLDHEIILYQEQKLEKIDNPGPAHFGMGNQHRRGM